MKTKTTAYSSRKRPFWAALILVLMTLSGGHMSTASATGYHFPPADCSAKLAKR